MMDKELEAAIDAVGRDKVFALMRANGWRHGDEPPKWAWWHAVQLAGARAPYVGTGQ